MPEERRTGDRPNEVAATLPTQSLIGVRDAVERSHVSTQTGRRYEFDLLRAAAVLLVFLFHFFSLLGSLPETWVEWNAFREFVLQIGIYGVDTLLFFTGFFIARSMAATDFGYLDYLKQRLGTIYAPYVSAVLAALAAGFVAPGLSKMEEGQNPAGYFVEQLLLVPGWFPEGPLLSVAWVLPLVVVGFLLTPLWHWPLREAGVWKCAGYWSATVCCGFLLAGLVDVPLRYLVIPAGVAAYFAAKAIESKLVGIWGPLIFLAAGLGTAMYVALGAAWGWDFPVLGMLGYELLALLLLATAILGSPATAAPRALAPVQFLGASSYSFYLVHGSITKVMLMVLFPGFGYQLGSPLDLAIALGVCLGAAVVGSQILYRLVESPVRFRLTVAPERELSEEEKRLLIASLQMPSQQMTMPQLPPPQSSGSKNTPPKPGPYWRGE
jgi:peptidoglycan/LPS O-acetylase OafA/YrhL